MQLARRRGEPRGTGVDAIRRAIVASLQEVVEAVGADFGRVSVAAPDDRPTVVAVGLDERGIAGPGSDAMAAFLEDPLPASWGRVITEARDDRAFRGRAAVQELIEGAGTRSVIIEPVFDGSRVIGTVCVGTLVDELRVDDDARALLSAALRALAVAARALVLLGDGREKGDELPPPSEPLSDRQVEVLQLLADGLRSSHIADRLYLSENTVRNHIKALLRAYNVSSQRELIGLIHSYRDAAALARR